MKGIIIVRDFMVFLSELAVLLLSLYFIITAGASMGDLVFSFDSRLAAETVFGLAAAADMAPGFEASFMMQPNPYKISIDKDGNSNFISMDSTREKFRVQEGATVKIQPKQKLYLITASGNSVKPLDSEAAAPAGGKMSESTSWLITVKKTGKETSVYASPIGGK
ncbi:MAG: hypothetical protein HY516_00590 [Candidatus Aenigmarchaeota archaeon]|nr:hypothetical protein [Candidatus Aenigmarchaeota archaeon]